MFHLTLQKRLAMTFVPDGTDPVMSNRPTEFPEVAVDDMVRVRSPDVCLIVPMEEIRGRVIHRSEYLPIELKSVTALASTSYPPLFFGLQMAFQKAFIERTGLCR